MKYILRCVIHESSWHRQLDDIVSLAKRTGISSVLLMEESHQIVMSAYTLERHRRMSEIYREIAKRLKEEGIGYSINIATLVGHCDSPLDEDELIDAVHWTSETLIPNDSTYCIMDTSWVKYASEVIRIYASTHPDTIMIDDDFRSLNHSSYLGCFCPLHVKAVSEKIGREISAKELRGAVRSGDKNSLAIRKAWMEVNADAQIKALKEFRKAADEIDPEIRLGLMNSGEPDHSLQGRDMVKMMDALEGKRKPASRPLGGAYEDTVHEAVVSIHQGMALSMEAVSDVGAYIISEVENWPHTLYTKSIKSTSLQMKMHTLAGADALSLNIYDYLASPYSQEPRFENLLIGIKSELDRIEELRKGKTPRGISIPWKKDTALFTPCFAKDRVVPDRLFDSVLPLLGVPTSFSGEGVRLIYGDTLEAMGKEGIRKVLSGKSILTSEAIRYLIDHGYSDELGIKSNGNVNCPGTMRFLENRYTGEFAGNLIANNWMRFCYQKRDIPLYEALKNAEVISEMTDQYETRIGDAIIIYKNSLGGTMVLLPIPVSSWTYSTRSIATVIRNIALSLSKDSDEPFAVVDGINVAPFIYSDDEGNGIIALVNTGLDDERVTIRGIDILENSVEVPALDMKILEFRKGIKA